MAGMAGMDLGKADQGWSLLLKVLEDDSWQ